VIGSGETGQEGPSQGLWEQKVGQSHGKWPKQGSSKRGQELSLVSSNPALRKSTGKGSGTQVSDTFPEQEMRAAGLEGHMCHETREGHRKGLCFPIHKIKMASLHPVHTTDMVRIKRTQLCSHIIHGSCVLRSHHAPDLVFLLWQSQSCSHTG
jgi:hypothetical protein